MTLKMVEKLKQFRIKPRTNVNFDKLPLILPSNGGAAKSKPPMNEVESQTLPMVNFIHEGKSSKNGSERRQVKKSERTKLEQHIGRLDQDGIDKLLAYVEGLSPDNSRIERTRQKFPTSSTDGAPDSSSAGDRIKPVSFTVRMPTPTVLAVDQFSGELGITRSLWLCNAFNDVLEASHDLTNIYVGNRQKLSTFSLKLSPSLLKRVDMDAERHGLSRNGWVQRAAIYSLNKTPN